MMEADLELLEEYLDGELGSAAALKLRERLAIDSPLTAALAELQSQRALRQAAYQSMEPSDLATKQLVWRVRGAMLDQQRQTAAQPKRQLNTWRIASFSSAAAACILLGFSMGRLGRNSAATSVTPNAQPSPMVVSNASVSPDSGARVTNIADNHSTGFTPLGTTPRISVPITNEYGQVVAWQTFDNAEQAKNFTEDLHRSRIDSTPATGAGQIKQVDSTQSPQVPF